MFTINVTHINNTRCFVRPAHSPLGVSLSNSVLPLMENTIPISFPFPLQDNDNADLNERIAFWDSPSTLEWFRQRGYTLYVRNELAEGQPWYSEPALACEHLREMHYPYPYYGSEENSKTPLPFKQGKIAYAQETRDPSHHVAIKLIVTDSEEHRILQFLQSKGVEILKENCLIPVRDILLNGPFSFAVMPRQVSITWGDMVHFPERGPIRSVIRIMHSMLKALVFLHENNILHRDIKLDNVLISHFADDATNYMDHSVRKRLQWSNELNYCLFDFDISMMLPADTDRTQCRLSYKLSWDGTGYQPHDTMQGEFDYNPFAYDVGTLGRVLCMRYQHLTPQIPMLAPFLDRMVTRNIPLRFNAAEALQFFEAMLPEIPENVMNSVFYEKTKASDYELDRWEGLPSDFIKKWEDYREPPVPSSTTVLRWIFSFERMPYILPVQGKIAYAQETHDPSHHVAIKLIVTDSDEHRILQFLHSQGMEVLKENCLVPILDILSNGPFSFVNARWSNVVEFPRRGPIRHVIRIMHSLLRALAFLHENNILHRDIEPENALVSHFADDGATYRDHSVRKRLQWSNDLIHCLFDFDISMMLPADTDRVRCRLSYKLAWDGSGYQPDDTMQGEFDYNPFAYDVGMLGRVLCVDYQHLVPQIPMLAPFLDRMVTRNISLRFNAAQALQFFEAFLPEISEEVLDSVYYEKTKASDYEWNRWEGLPPNFIKKWEDYREPPVPFSTTVLRWIFSFERMPYILPVVRLFFFRITLIPSRIGIIPKKLWSRALPS
ncbi:hypothetical protein AGABI2DRAFT_120971 [Agaricus bisporus var. bisporus H97]|uniref:hypothetical protein n=1 Tax=Agaricus bisporus var. bisporus (strain H97 / ATCC MYA-4626 / FGSC 10389) TaxID=936046 RepID=UPI00029F536F|nr:hypothetical protein AGABI2DRAFT_120971 [Agaricus bisporus var. bisporus H97]EKV43753.1 hypothetical protein AGABI2DRAFT_120971 [Agaricus bisporus var. bisporus H97]